LDLQVMRPNQTLAELTSRLIERLDEVLVSLAPDWVLVQGDTTSAMAGALAAFYRRVPVGHVEAGLRTGNPASPFPEEINRRIITQCATLHFAPTVRARETLLREGIAPPQAILTGNTVVDALAWIRDSLRRAPSQLPDEVLSRINGHRLLLVTTHRRENIGQPLENICLALQELNRRDESLAIVLPVHPNPNVSGMVRGILGDEQRVILIEPQPYRTLLELMDRALLVLTDSGGLQEEAPSFGKPVLVLRDTTERPEGIEAGVAQLIGTSQEAIVQATLRLLDEPAHYARMAQAQNPYGDGRASTRIISSLDAANGSSTDSTRHAKSELLSIETGAK
jgi:UDP-N-acetylglucosamine 2-epimerase